MRWEEDERFLTICPEGGQPATYEVEETSSGWNLHKSGSNVCYRVSRMTGCNCPDADKRGKLFECKHYLGLKAAMSKLARRVQARVAVKLSGRKV